MECFTCKKLKEDDAFYRLKGKKPMCKACNASRMSSYLKSNVDARIKQKEYKQRTRPIKRKEKREFLNWLKTAPCMDCGNCYLPFVMDFDHREPKNSREKSISRISTNNTSAEKLMEEIYKCDLVCANCHRMRTLSRFKS